MTAATPNQATKPLWLSHLALALLLVLQAIAGVLGSALAWCVGGDFYWTVALAGAFGNGTLGFLATAVLYLAFRNRRRLLLTSLGVLFVLQLLITITCSEFILQRGAPIAPIDVVNGLDVGFIRSQIGVLYSRHFGPFIALSVAVVAAALLFVGRMRKPSTRREVAVVLGVLALFTMLSMWVHRMPRGMPPPCGPTTGCLVR